MTLGHGQPKGLRGKLGKPPHVQTLLRREGFQGRLALEVMAELVTAKLLDIDLDDGTVSLHDAPYWQERVKNAQRQQRWRDEHPGPTTAVTPPLRAVTGNETGERDRQTGEDHAGATAGNGLAPKPQSNDLYKLFRALTDEVPDRRHLKWMDDLTVQEGEDAVGRKAVADVMRQWKPEKGDLLGWTSAKLRGGRT
jgi:hypothetical protein